MTPLHEFRVTFGQQYRHESHATWPPAHPDGWLTIEAPSELKARAVAFRLLGPHWAFIYSDVLSSRMFPLGELERIPWGQVASTPDSEAAAS